MLKLTENIEIEIIYHVAHLNVLNRQLILKLFLKQLVPMPKHIKNLVLKMEILLLFV